MRECKYYEITIEKLLDVVHTYTDPVRIKVIMDHRCDFAEASRMHDFYLTTFCRKEDREEVARILKYYADVPVWNLTTWTDTQYWQPNLGKAIRMGINANCHYSDVREGYLAEKADNRKKREKEYRKRRKEAVGNESSNRL